MFHLVKSVLASQQENRIIRPRRALDLFSCRLGFIACRLSVIACRGVDSLKARRHGPTLFFFRPIDFSQLHFGRRLKLLGKIYYGPTTSQKAGYALSM